MLEIPQRGLFIAGSDTEVGKTYVACQVLRALVCRGIAAAGYKPVASGWTPGVAAEQADATLLWHASQQRGTLEQVCPQRFEAPLAPHLAAAAEGREVDVALLSTGAEAWRDQCDVLIVEGAGGLFSPLAPQTYNMDLAIRLGYPLLLVVENKIGAINQSLQALLTAVHYAPGIDIAGIILNQASPRADASVPSNADEIRSRCDLPLLAEIPYAGAPQSEVWERFLDRFLAEPITG